MCRQSATGASIAVWLLALQSHLGLCHTQRLKVRQPPKI
jgi:hypothetical protein